ncbi:M16 family metallopeptidase [Planctomyces sp. SH-PL62]|uniref:M16 family metallopeptidase n=1 Tax=Planctomyces sp. SH-PL62 TaxID=1636152 RepID=UPI00078E8BC9|nr:pitrilysin family protein [Planctomyces sp. SH-PL62]AMV36531.1 Peptidase M16 inactive domain protein [Planctomyces sp. SH-PL62]
MRLVARASLALLLCLGATPARPQQAPSDAARTHEVPALAVEKYTLPNGLTVILHEDHKTPIAAVHLWYKVGSKDEKPGRTGFAHLFEHLMFQGSQHHDRDYFEPLEKLGAEINGNTTEDRTVYFESVPSNATELALWLEADRMGFLIPAITQAKLDNQRDVVKNERRESVENVPYGLAEEALRRALYPEGHPYRHEVIGSMADLSAADLGDVSAFFQTYYAPDNAILCVAGDIDRERVKGWIQKSFGPIPRGPKIDRPAPWVPRLDGPKRIAQTDRVSLPRAQLVWPTVPSHHPDEPALDVLAAVLGQLDKENRLYRALMHDRRLAAEVHAQHPTLELSGSFEVDLLAPPGGDLDDVVAIAMGEIDRLKREGPTLDEVIKSRNARESGLILGLQSVLARAEVFCLYEAVSGDPLGYRDELQRLFAVTPEDVRRVANHYLTDAFIRLDVTPGPAPERPAEPEVARPEPSPFEPTPQTRVADDSVVMPEVGAPPAFTPPAFVRRTLSNGLPIWIVPRRELPIVSFRLVVGFGETSAPGGKEGLGSLTVGLLDAGTKRRDSFQIAGALAEIGASLDLTCGLEWSGATVTTLLRHMDRALDVFADAILAPTFPEDEVERRKLLRLADLESRRDSADEVAEDLFRKLLFGGEHPYGRPQFGTEESVASITRADAAAFHEAYFIPSAATLIVVGDVDPDAIARTLEARFGGWKARPAPPKVVPTPPTTNPDAVFVVDKPGAAQSVLAIGRLGVERKSPEAPALGVLNAIVGGQFSSRLNMKLREEKGYSYGVGSDFRSLRAPGWFEVRGSVQTAVTRESVEEIRRELAELHGPRPITDAEFDSARRRVVYGFPSRFETTFDVADQLSEPAAYDLGDDYLATYLRRVEAVDRARIQELADRYLKPEAMTTLIVGDRDAIEPELRKLPEAADVRFVDEDGSPVQAVEGK